MTVRVIVRRSVAVVLVVAQFLRVAGCELGGGVVSCFGSLLFCLGEDAA